MRAQTYLIAAAFGVVVLILASSTLSLVYMVHLLPSHALKHTTGQLVFLTLYSTKNKKLIKQLRIAEEKAASLAQRLTDMDRKQRSPITKTDRLPAADKTRDGDIAIIIFCYNRPDYLRRSLNSLLAQTVSDGFQIFVSQDGGADNVLRPDVTSVIKEYGDKVTHLKHIDPQPIEMDPNDPPMPGYYAIARHYKFGLSYLFNTLKYEHVVAFEDDLEAASDMVSYFQATRRLLREDKSLLCVSAFNDQGKAEHVRDAQQLYRSDYFPGLGFMIGKDVWGEFEAKWPRAFWDDWVREPGQREGRQCVYPEVSRTITFGVNGVSLGQFFDQHLATIKLNTDTVDFSRLNLDYLLHDNYDERMKSQIRDLDEVATIEDMMQRVREERGDRGLMLQYDNLEALYQIADRTIPTMMKDAKAGVFRTSYKGIVSIYQGKHKVFFTPKA